METKNKIILGAGILIIALLFALLYTTHNHSTVGGKTEIVTQTRYVFDTVIKPSPVRIEKVKLIETVIVEKEDSIKIKSLINVIDSLEREVVMYGSTKKLSLDTIVQPGGDTLKLVIDKYKNLIDTFKFNPKPIIVKVAGETKTIMLPQSNQSLWIAGALGAVSAVLIMLIFGR